MTTYSTIITEYMQATPNVHLRWVPQRGCFPAKWELFEPGGALLIGMQFDRIVVSAPTLQILGERLAGMETA
jgi:hypothetical protein